MQSFLVAYVAVRNYFFGFSCIGSKSSEATDVTSVGDSKAESEYLALVRHFVASTWEVGRSD